MPLQGQQTEPWQILLSLGFYVFIFISIFYGQKIQLFIYSRQLNEALVKFKDTRDETKAMVKAKILELRKKGEKLPGALESDVPAKGLDVFLDEFMSFAMIEPVSLDPAGIIAKLDHLIDVRENRWEAVVRKLVPGIPDIDGFNLENLIEAAMAIDQVYRVVRHFHVQGKKTGSLVFVMQMAMQIKIIEQMVDAYAKASKAFYQGQPIGDGLGPQVAATLVRQIHPDGQVKAEETVKETTVQVVSYKNRTLYVVRAKGPGGTVGKPGEAIKRLIGELGGNVARVMMIDAAMKLEGEASGSVVEGVGAAIGGIGTEKYKIEEASTSARIPVDAFLCRQNLSDAITTMRKPISMCVKTIVERVKLAIETRTSEGDNVIVAGIGNTIGIGY